MLLTAAEAVGGGAAALDATPNASKSTQMMHPIRYHGDSAGIHRCVCDTAYRSGNVGNHWSLCTDAPDNDLSF